MKKSDLIVIIADEIETGIAHLVNNEDLDVMSEVSIRVASEVFETLREMNYIKELEDNEYEQ